MGVDISRRRHSRRLPSGSRIQYPPVCVCCVECVICIFCVFACPFVSCVWKNLDRTVVPDFSYLYLTPRAERTTRVSTRSVRLRRPSRTGGAWRAGRAVPREGQAEGDPAVGSPQLKSNNGTQRRSRLEIESGGVWVRVPIKTVCLSDAPVSTSATQQATATGIFRVTDGWPHAACRMGRPRAASLAVNYDPTRGWG